MLWVVSLQVSAHNFYAKFIKITIMKSLIKLFTNTFILLSSITASFAQIEDHYHSFSGNIYVPIIVAHQSTMKLNDGRKTENNIPDKKTPISVYMNGENMAVSKGLFSGTIIKTNSVEDEVITYIGKVSKDKQMLEYIEITKDYTIYLLYTRETIEKTISLAVRFENIPSYFGGYWYKFGVSKITSVSYTEDYSVPYYGHTESYSEKFIAVDTTLISEYYSGINVKFKPGVLKLDPVSHITIEGPDTICRGVIGEENEENALCEISLIAKSNIPGGTFKWKCNSKAIVFIELIEGNGSEIWVRALADYLPSPKSVEIKVTHSIGAFEDSATHVLHLRGGYYYFWPNCSQLFKLGIITESERKECEDDEDKCEDSLRLSDVIDENNNLIIEHDGCNKVQEVEYLSLILEEHLLSASGIVDSDTKLNSKKLNWYYKLWDENGDPYPDAESGQPREFVTQYPCMKKWIELGKSRDK